MLWFSNTTDLLVRQAMMLAASSRVIAADPVRL
jgi:hypothetical protein